MNTTRMIAALGAWAALAIVAPAANAQSVRPAAVIGEKQDSGLGDLPPYSQWEDKTGRRPMGNRVVGESLDDGLGELPHYSRWIDPSGRDPLGRLQAKKVATR